MSNDAHTLAFAKEKLRDLEECIPEPDEDGGVVSLRWLIGEVEGLRAALDYAQKARVKAADEGSDWKAEAMRLRAIQKAADRVVRCTTAEAAYKRHDVLIEALDAAEAAKEPGDAS
jgi:hypothetical protein